MNALFQKFLELSESANLSEGELLTITGALKTAFDTSKADTILQIKPIRVDVKVRCATHPFTLHFTKKIRTDTSEEYQCILDIADGAQSTKSIRSVDLEQLIIHLAVNSGATEISLEQDGMKVIRSKSSSSSQILLDTFEKASELDYEHKIHRWIHLTAFQIRGILQEE
jgi:hypothetical protein